MNAKPKAWSRPVLQVRAMPRVFIAGVPGSLMAGAALLLTGWAARATEPETQPSEHLAEQAGKPVPMDVPGDYVRILNHGGRERRYLVHIPPGLEKTRPAPLVLLLHGAAMNARMMAGFSGMNAQSDAAGFIAVYPEGTGAAGTFLTWNSGGIGPVRTEPDDTGFLRHLLDTLEGTLKVDPRRIYAAGMSNGGMMSYRLAAALPDRIAAVASVGGTLAVEVESLSRPVPLIHFHGTEDRIVPWAGPSRPHPERMSFLPVEQSVARWAALNGCPEKPVVRQVKDRIEDGTQVEIRTRGPGRQGAETVLVEIRGGGHTWPGRQPAVALIGRSTREIQANTMIWDFFRKHPLPPAP